MIKYTIKLENNFEMRRKIFHFMSVIVPIFYLLTDKLTMVMFLTITTGIALALDISRHYSKEVRYIIDRFFKTIMREEEYSGTFKLSGVSYMFLGFFISCILFSKGVAIASFLVLIISDSLAAIVGQNFGGTSTKNQQKSLEGSLAFFISSFLIGILSYTLASYITSFSSIMVASLITTLAEYYSKKININDNLLIPIIFGLSITIF